MQQFDQRQFGSNWDLVYSQVPIAFQELRSAVNFHAQGILTTKFKENSQTFPALMQNS